MAWFNALNWNVRNLLPIENPNKVLDVVAQHYSYHNIHRREDSLVLYGLPENTGNFELVLHRPFNESLTEAYSLCRCKELNTALEKFLLFKDKLPVLVSVCKDLYNSTQIQKICDILVEYQTWNVAHLAVRLEQADSLSSRNIALFINTPESACGLSPLQLAIQDQNIKMVQALLSNNASLDHYDHEHNSVLHYAANTNKQIVNLLCEKSKNALNSRNVFGRTPLHVACYSDKRDCVHALLEAGADVNISVMERKTSIKIPGCVSSIQDFPKKVHGDDIKYGGTPLHWACSGEVIEALVNKNCDINSLNFDQRTALHVMVLRNRLDCLVTLLSFKADCNIADKDGNTPLHLAVKEENVDCVKALIVFGADMSYFNNEGNLPRHGISLKTETGKKILYILHSVGAPRCHKNQNSCNPGCHHNGTYFGLGPPKSVSSTSRELLDYLLMLKTVENFKGTKKGRLLSLDGGGIRGLVLIMILMEMEKYFCRPLYECFDWIAGTSTGGILNLALGSKIPLFDCLCLYFKFKNVAFCGKRPYPSENLENMLKEIFGETTTMEDIKHPKLMVMSTIADRLPVELHIFRNYPSPYEILNIPHEGPFLKPPAMNEHFLWEIARATGAAPTYFRAFGKFLDGGLIANNPTVDALTEIEEYNTALIATGKKNEVLEVSLVVSVGTGIFPAKPLSKEIDIFRPKSLWDTSKFLVGVSTMGEILTDQVTQTDGRVVDRARSWCSSLKIPYFRFSPNITENVQLNEKCNQKLTDMLWQTKAYMHSKSLELITLSNIIKEST